jgi:hypothetical protein
VRFKKSWDKERSFKSHKDCKKLRKKVWKG